MKHTVLRHPFLLYSYLTTEMLAPFFASFLVLNGVFFLAKLIPFLNFALDLNIGFADFLRMLSYMFPNMLLYTIPMSSMMGIIIGFSRLANDMEILALKASGVSIYTLLPPLLTIATVISLATGYCSTQLIPSSERAMKLLTYQLMKEKVDKGIKEYHFSEALGDIVVHIEEIDDETGSWKNVWVSDLRGQKNPTITMASEGKMISDPETLKITIILNNGSLHRPDGKDAQIVGFEQYTIDIPMIIPRNIKSKHRRSLYMNELLAEAEKRGLDAKEGKRLMIEYHKRLVLPFGCMIMTILGLPLGLQAGPGKKAIGIPLGLAVFIFYYAFFTAGKSLSYLNGETIGLSMWLPNIFFLFVTLYCIYRVANEKPLISDKVGYGIQLGYSTVVSPFAKLFSKLKKR